MAKAAAKQAEKRKAKKPSGPKTVAKKPSGAKTAGAKKDTGKVKSGKNKKDRDVGGMAENALEIICRDVKANPQKSRHDEIGIDYLVTFPNEHGAVATLLQQIPELSCVVQVKGSDDDTPSVSLRYITWLRLIYNPLPVFILLIHFGNGTWPTRAFLLPIDRERASEALKVIHAVQPPSDKILHRRSLQIAARQGEQLPTVTGAALREAIRNHIPDLRAAIHAKSEWYTTLDGGPSIRLTVETPREATQDLIDFALGLRNEFSAIVKRVEEIRYSVAHERPRPVGLVKISSPSVPPTTTARLRFLSPNGRPAEFQCDVYHPVAVFPFLKNEKYSIRFKGILVDFYLDRTTMQMTQALDFHSCFSQRAMLDDWLMLFRLLRLATQNIPTLQLEMGGEVVKIDIPYSAAGPLPPQVVEMGIIVDYIEEIVRMFGCEIRDPFTLRQVFEDREKIRTLYAVAVGSPEMRLGLKVPASPEWLDEQASKGKQFGHVVIAAAQIADEFFLATALIFGNLSSTEEATEDGMVWASLVPPHVEIVDRHCEHVFAKRTLALKPWYQKANKRAQELGIELLDTKES